MKINANGNELSIGLSPHEIKLLRGASLVEKKVKFHSPHRERYTEVRVCLSLFPEPFMFEDLKNEGIYASTLPARSYFPDARSVFLFLGDEMFHELITERYSCRRRHQDKIKIYDLERPEVYR